MEIIKYEKKIEKYLKTKKLCTWKPSWLKLIKKLKYFEVPFTHVCQLCYSIFNFLSNAKIRKSLTRGIL